MTVEDLYEQVRFIVAAMSNKRTRLDITDSVKVFVRLSNQTVALNVREIGFNDKDGMVYIETEGK